MVFAEVCLITNDVQRLSDFYKMILKTTSDSEDNIHQQIATQGAALAIYYSGNAKETKNENMYIAFTVENVDAEHERLQHLGVNIIEPPTTRAWGARNMLFQDPDGNNIAFRSFPVQ